MQLPSVPRKSCSHHEKFEMAAQAGPLPRALPLGVMVFCIPRQISNEKKNTKRQHEGKNSCHRDSAVTAHTVSR